MTFTPGQKRTMTYNQVTSCPDIEPGFVELYEKCRPFTMTSLERMYGLYKAVEHIVRNGIGGDIAECGVWRGGSILLAAETLAQMGDTSRTLWLYDTFTGMPTPDDVHDTRYDGAPASSFVPVTTAEGWCQASLEDVKANLRYSAYPQDRFRFVQGMVEETIPVQVPEKLALLRLDTDWYASTRHELVHLYPRLERGGALIIDDYGHWQGARKATDEYIAEHALPLYLARLDYTGRVATKP
jgi:hypothetical protein